LEDAGSGMEKARRRARAAYEEQMVGEVCAEWIRWGEWRSIEWEKERKRKKVKGILLPILNLKRNHFTKCFFSN
jgi:hypothetical protein